MESGLIYGCLTPHPPILVPAVAGRRVDQVRQTREAMQQVAADVAALSPDALVLVSPHAALDPQAMSLFTASRYCGSFEDFGSTSVELSFPGDSELSAAIRAECQSYGVPARVVGKAGAVHRLDHGATVPLFFLREAGVECRLVLASFSARPTEEHRRFGRAIAAASKRLGKRVALIGSGDLSHRLTPGAPAGFSPRGREFDEGIVGALSRGDREAVLQMDEDLLYEAGECGYRSVVIALGALPEASPEVLSYEGPFGVGYVVARFRVETPETTPEEGHEESAPSDPRVDDGSLELARLAVDSYLRTGRMAPPPLTPAGLLAERAGVFVCLKIGGQLRGCIGTFEPTEANIAEEIMRNAVAAATRDPRFLPVTPEELPLLHYSIDVLSPPEPVDDPLALDPRRYGVIVQSGTRRGLLLPDLEGVTTVGDQIDIARRKAGIPPNNPVQLYRFTVRRISEAG